MDTAPKRRPLYREGKNQDRRVLPTKKGPDVFPCVGSTSLGGHGSTLLVPCVLPRDSGSDPENDLNNHSLLLTGSRADSDDPGRTVMFPFSTNFYLSVCLLRTTPRPRVQGVRISGRGGPEESFPLGYSREQKGWSSVKLNTKDSGRWCSQDYGPTAQGRGRNQFSGKGRGPVKRS